jgi:glucan biosynthesis protein C
MSYRSTKPTRRRDLDVTRELIVVSLIFFHTARIFDQFDYYIKNKPQEPAVTFVVIMTSFWGMPLIFVIAGFAIWHSLQNRTVGAFVRERLRRLFVPFVLGLLIFVPPQTYFQLCVDPGYQESYLQFYQHFFTVKFNIGFPQFISASPITGLFTTSHLWFLYVLLVFTLLLLPGFLYLRKPGGRHLIEQFIGFFSRPWAIFLLGLPIAVIEAALGTSLSGGWNESAYIFFLCYGYMLAADVRFGHTLKKYWKIGLLLVFMGSMGGILAFSVIAESTHSDPLHSYDLASVMLRFVKGFIGWCWMVAILGFLEEMREKRQLRSQKHESRVIIPHSGFLINIERYAREAILPFYLLHQTVIVIIAFYVVQWHTSAFLKFLIISFTALATTLLLYEIVVKRIWLLRFCFGMKPIKNKRGQTSFINN